METRLQRKKRIRLEKLVASEANDQITNLPELVLHDIIARLPSRASFRLSLLSKRWLYLVETSPCINFELNEFQDGHGNILFSKVDEFLRSCLSLRSSHVLQKVRFSSDVVLSTFDDFMRRCTELASRGRIQELDLCCSHNWNPWCVCVLLPKKFFKCELHLTVLKLEGCWFGEHTFAGLPILTTLSLAYVQIGDHTLSDMVGICPRLESLILECCGRLKAVSVTSSSLRRVIIRHCIRVKSVYMDLPLLHTFEYDSSEQGKNTDPWNLTETTEFRTAKDVKLINVEVLYLSYLKMDSETLKHLFDVFPNVTNLRMKGCFVKYQSQTFPSNLKKLVVVDVHLPELIEGVASSVEVLHCDSTKLLGLTSYVSAGTVNFVCLKSVTLAGFFLLTDEALKRLISSCPRLEILNLRDCLYFKHLKIDSPVLKILTVKAKADYLESAEIETPKLVSFEYDGPIIECNKVIFSPALVGRLSFKKSRRYPIDPELQLLKDVVEKFKNASRLTLEAEGSELILLSSSSERPLPCWAKWGHLKMNSGNSYTCHQEILKVLFISECCTKLSIELSSSSIHLEFADPARLDAVSPVTVNGGEVHDCVRDHLIQATFKNFEGNSHELRLAKFLRLQANKMRTLVLNLKSELSLEDCSIREAIQSLTDVAGKCAIMTISR